MARRIERREPMPAARAERLQRALIRTFGRNVRKFRRQQNLSQQQLGDMADLGPNYLGQAEHGVANAGCGGHEEFVELLTGIPGASRPVRRIVLIKRSGG
jgi:ribosome-binding protein aMBF1 (putative translation factor)